MNRHHPTAVLTIVLAMTALIACSETKQDNTAPKDTVNKTDLSKDEKTHTENEQKKTKHPITASDITLFLMHGEKVHEIFNSYEKQLSDTPLPSEQRLAKTRAKRDVAEHLTPQGVDVDRYLRQSGRIVALFIALKVKRDDELFTAGKVKEAAERAGEDGDRAVAAHKKRLKAFSRRIITTSTDDERALIESSWNAVEHILRNSGVL